MLWREFLAHCEVHTVVRGGLGAYVLAYESLPAFSIWVAFY